MSCHWSGYKYFLEKNFVPNNYALSSGQTVIAIITQMLADTGLSHLYTTGGITAGQVLDRVVGNDDTADQVIRRIGTRVGHHVWVDPLLEIQMRERSQPLCFRCSAYKRERFQGEQAVSPGTSVTRLSCAAISRPDRRHSPSLVTA